MYLAAIGDIHGNLPALEAVLAAIDDAGIQTIVNTGDAVVGHPWPNEVVEILRARNIRSVQGEADRRLVHFVRKEQTLRRKLPPAEFDALQQAHEAITSQNLEFLRTLPRRRALHVEGIDICLCHGTPTSQSETLAVGDSEAKFRRVRETANARLIICGGTHRAFSRIVDDALFVNPGAVGVAPEGAAAYAVIDTEVEPWSVRLEETGY